MALALTESCRYSRLVMQRVTCVLSELESSTEPRQTLDAQFRKLQLLTKALQAAFSKIDVEQTSTFQIILEDAHSGFMACFADLVARLVPHLHALGSNGNDRRDLEVSSDHSGIETRATSDTGSSVSSLVLPQSFVLLWEILVTICTAMGQWPRKWPDSAHNTQLQDCLHSFSTWLTSFARNNSQALSMLTAMHLDTDLSNAAILLEIYYLWIANPSMSGEPRDRTQTPIQLHSNLLSIICCLTCDHHAPSHASINAHPKHQSDSSATTSVGASPKPFTFDTFFDLLTAVQNLHELELAISTKDTQLMDSLAVPSVLQLLKLALSVCDSHDMYSSDPRSFDTITVLTLLRALLLRIPEAGSAISSTTCLPKINKLSDGRPSLPPTESSGVFMPSDRPSFHMHPRVLTPVSSLIPMLLRLVERQGKISKLSYSLMSCISASWSAEDMDEQQAGSVITLTHHVMNSVMGLARVVKHHNRLGEEERKRLHTRINYNQNHRLPMYLLSDIFRLWAALQHLLEDPVTPSTADGGSAGG